jgi:hypothetical protein
VATRFSAFWLSAADFQSVALPAARLQHDFSNRAVCPAVVRGIYPVRADHRDRFAKSVCGPGCAAGQFVKQAWLIVNHAKND